MLNIVLAFLAMGIAVVLIILAVIGLAGSGEEYLQPMNRLLIFVTLTALGIVSLIYWIGQRWATEIASTLLLIGLIALLMFSDDLDALINGRSIFYFSLPIVLASVLLRPWTSLATAALIICMHATLSVLNGLEINLLAAVGYVILAAFTWLAASELEQALRQLRAINLELDQRVTERTRDLSDALSKIQTEAGKNQAILQSITDGVIVFDPDGRILTSNPALAHLTGKSPAQVTGRGIDAWIRAAAPAGELERLRGVFHSSGAAPASIDWNQRVLSISVAPVQLESDQTIGSVAVFHDITREVEVSRIKTAFVAMVSHELRTPLNAILGMVEILEQNLYGTLNEKQQGVVRRILTNIQKLNRLVSDLLDQAQIEAGTLTIHHEPFSLTDLLSGVEETAVSAVQAKKISFTYEIDPQAPGMLVGDIHRLNQVLTNLVMNAVKFTEHGGVHVRCYCPDETHWAAEVQDTGAGIPEKAQQKIFEPFQQVDTSIGRKHGGFGLGLAIVKQLVTLMEGEIKLSSQVGTGSIFSVVFPLHLPEPDAE